MANYWKNFLPETLFACPNAPEICKVNPSGFQWFDLMDQSEDEILSKSLSLTGRMEPFSDYGNRQILEKGGFSDIEVIFRFINFQGYLCIK